MMLQYVEGRSRAAGERFLSILFVLCRQSMFNSKAVQNPVAGDGWHFVYGFGNVLEFAGDMGSSTRVSTNSS